ncbi:MAG: DNA alkylation repair protein [Candidatus Wildermuthbacteria bacterium]|nr:DNA alkylation repair protein [Candidatus Wildermuthbacteria bacterium]
MLFERLKADLRKFANPKKKEILQRFFKTGPGQYGEGDVFLGVMVSESRSLAVAYKNLSFSDIKKLLASPVHEERLVGLLILVYNFQKGGAETQKTIYRYYLAHTKHVNNWDLVDLTADKIVGQYLLDNPKEITILGKLARSKNLWERRIAIIATFQFIKCNQFKPTLQIAQLLMRDEHDLIHKAVGWMLREVGKRDKKVEMDFLKIHKHIMPRLTLRYAIERFSPAEKTRVGI